MPILGVLDAQTAEPVGRFRVGAEARTRYERVWSVSDAPPGDYLTTRIRFSGRWKLAGGLSILWAVQDARLSGAADQDYSAPFTNKADLRIASIEWSSPGPQPWTVSAGRQEFSLGEERLVGSDSEWCNISRGFDGLKVSRSSGSWQWEAFHFNLVEPEPNRLDRPFTGHRIAGATASYSSEAGGWSLQPYFIHTSMPDISTTGGLMELNLGPRVRAWTEMAAQTSRSHRAWAGMWGADVTLRAGAAPAATLGAYFSRASGDKDPDDGRHTTFHDLFPAGHNSCGLLDPFAWRNLDDAAATFEWHLTPRLSIQAENHSYWLVTTKDGLYAGGGPATYQSSSASSRHVGGQLNFGVTFSPQPSFVVFGGAARLWRGGFLRQLDVPGQTTLAAGIRWQI